MDAGLRTAAERVGAKGNGRNHRQPTAGLAQFELSEFRQWPVPTASEARRMAWQLNASLHEASVMGRVVAMVLLDVRDGDDEARLDLTDALQIVERLLELIDKAREKVSL